MSDESRFEGSNKVQFVCGDLSDEGNKSSGKISWHEVRHSGEGLSSATTRRVGMWVE
jgi:hypothetical protein